jgi:hypothetical protein
MPAIPPTVSGVEVFGEDCDSRSYVYTYFIDGEESAPSPPTQPLTIKDGDSVLVGIPVLETVGVALYRSVTGARTGGEDRREPQSIYLLVDLIFPSATEIYYYEDTKLMRNLGHELTTQEMMPPPEGLRGFTHVKSTGVLAAIGGNQVFFSENFEPYNWPLEYVLTLPHRAINIGSLDTSVFVTTSSRAYVIKGMQACEGREGRDVLDTDHPYPDIGRGHRACASTPFGLIFATLEGLAQLSSDSKVKIISSPWFSATQWQRLRPETIRMAYWRGMLMFVTDVAGFILDLDTDTYGGYQLGALSAISDRPVDLLCSNNDELLLLENGEIRQWNAGPRFRPYLWRSAELFFDGRTTPTVAKVGITGRSALTLINELGDEYTTDIVSDAPARLKRLGRYMSWRVQLTGTGEVRYLDLATANSTLSRGL